MVNKGHKGAVQPASHQADQVTKETDMETGSAHPQPIMGTRQER